MQEQINTIYKLRIAGQLDEALRLVNGLIGQPTTDKSTDRASDQDTTSASGLTAAQKSELLLARASILDPLGQPAAALDDALASLQLAEQNDDPRNQALAAGYAAALAQRNGQVARALDLAVQALVTAEDPRCSLGDLTAASGNAALLLELLGAPRSAAALIERALGRLDGDTGVPTGVRDQLRASLALLLASSLASQPAALVGAADLERVDALARQLQDAAAAPAYHRRNVPLVMVTLLARCGRLAQARQWLQALDAMPAPDDPEAQMQAWRARAAVALAEGDAARSVTAVNEALGMARRLGLGDREVDLLAARAEGHRALGNAARAADDLAAALALARAQAGERVERLASQVLERAEAERSRRALGRRAADLELINEQDTLTGLANRRRYERELRSRGDATVALLMCDLDHFKAVNDRHGHPVGDQVLVRAAACLLAAVRADDLVMRWGGEEFVLILACSDAALAEATANRLRRALADADWQDLLGPGGVQTMSVGLATGTLADTSLLGRADAALYRAKQQGRNRVAVDVTPA
jgi:diguanylate cyclase (GGDEF)-like protein